MDSDKAKTAYVKMFSRKMNCAQAVFSTFSGELGIESNIALSIAQGFGGGMGHNDGMCGAVTGAYMALGLSQKASIDNPRENINKTYELMNEFNRRFKKLHGALNCTGLLGYDLSKPDELVKARDSGVFTTKCPLFVRDAAGIVEELLKTK
jgi:C_GCAxxG_C_C family probable redox protein